MCVVYSGETRFRLTVVGGMATGSPWAGVNITVNALVYYFKHVENWTNVYKLR
jgi:hypothetical protein